MKSLAMYFLLSILFGSLGNARAASCYYQTGDGTFFDLEPCDGGLRLKVVGFSCSILENLTQSIAACIGEEKIARIADITEIEIKNFTIIHTIKARAFEGFVNLRSLDLSSRDVKHGGGMKVVEGNAFDGLINLEKLDLSSQKITSWSDRALPKTRKLKYLDLRGNPKICFPRGLDDFYRANIKDFLIGATVCQAFVEEYSEKSDTENYSCAESFGVPEIPVVSSGWRSYFSVFSGLSAWAWGRKKEGQK